ncbi:DUF4214 domain-containing protein [Rhizobium sp. SSA_523]|uniref:beta strand repeat-containing protein n=1 Tax=Rhizobium sp. SSA_523 TaxID=2952477 RepID=UPI0020915F4D|nr:DUF4214 domain-containing protein [Rhizobium sp. SSA_523]MCO5734714.1 DUF4214 domain-containing protein [Rhizobium sp. SSA_523]WKC21003.1 DUF4214 domain-containing protein [Rhizobium sp. SSA_523]
MATIQGVYVALFGRPADPTGLAYFNSVTNNGANLSGINNLSGTAEYQARFTGLNNIQIINSIYQSLFGRDADLAGLNFFADALAKGTLNINNIAIAILDGAQGNDKTIVTNKVAAADLYTKALDTGSEVVAYSGLAAAAQGRAFISGVSTTVPTAAAVDTAVAAMVSASNGGGTGSAGVTLVLGTGNDFISPTVTSDAAKSTAGNDTIVATTASALASTDSIDGGAGTDTLNAPVAVGSIAPVLNSVEIINLTGPSANLSAGADNTAAGQNVTFDGTNVKGAQQLNISGVKLVSDDTSGTALQGASLATTGVDKAVVVGLKDVGSVAAAAAANGDTAFVNVGFSSTGGSSDSATISVNNVTSANAANAILQVGVAGIENLTINTTGAASSFALSDAQFTKLTIGGDKDLTLVNATGNSALKTVDASALTGKLIYTATANGETISGGKGADSITLAGGSDTVVYTAANKSTLVAMDTIFSFTATGQDKIDLKAFGLSATTIGATTLNPGADQVGLFSSSTGGTAATNYIVFNDTTKMMYVDLDKNGNFDATTDLAFKLDSVSAVNIDKTDFLL